MVGRKQRNNEKVRRRNAESLSGVVTKIQVAGVRPGSTVGEVAHQAVTANA